MKKSGRIFVISAPSGSGKTTICRMAVNRLKNLAYSVSATTRRPRRSEKDKKDYRYISESSFKKEIKKGSFLEWEKNFGHFYGTPKDFALRSLAKGKNVLLSIDVKGAMQIKKKFRGTSTLIFIAPPSIKELLRRLKGRNTDKRSEIAKRLKIAGKELLFIPRYDYTVVNDKLEDAVKKVVSIIKKCPKGS